MSRTFSLVVGMVLVVTVLPGLSLARQDFTGITYDPQVDGKYYLDNNPLPFPRISCHASDNRTYENRYWVDGEYRTYTDEQVCRAYAKFDLIVAFDAGPRWTRMIRQYRRQWYTAMGCPEGLTPPTIILNIGLNATVTRDQILADPRKWAEDNYERIKAINGGQRLDEGDPEELADGWYHDQMPDVGGEAGARFMEAAQANRDFGGRNAVILNNDGSAWAEYHNGRHIENFPHFYGGWIANVKTVGSNPTSRSNI